MTDLKPCPIIGCEGNGKFYCDEADFFSVCCDKCGFASQRFLDKESAQKHWHTRHSPWIKITEQDYPTDEDYCLLKEKDGSYSVARFLNKETSAGSGYIDRAPSGIGLIEVGYTHYFPISRLPEPVKKS